MTIACPYNPSSEEMRRDPVGELRRLREVSPIQWVDDLNFWVFARYEDCRELARDPRLSFQPGEDDFGANMSMEHLADVAQDRMEDLFKGVAVLKSSFSFMDPPDHTRIRSLVAQAFASRTIADYRPTIERIAGQLLDALDTSEPVDLVDDYANPLPIMVICHIIGIPVDDRPLIRDWFDRLEVMMVPEPDPESLPAGLQALMDLTASIEDLVELRRAHPESDLVSALVAAGEEGDRLTTMEVVSTIITIFGAGSTTTQRLISNGLIALVRHPNELELLRREPELWPSAIEELLRFHIPDFRTDVPRTALEAFEYKGHKIKKGQSVRLLVGAASRDPERFENPDQLDVRRADNKHLVFGRGEHFCLGAPIARLEGEVALKALIDRFDSIELLDDVQANSDALHVLGFPTVPVRLA